MHSPFVFEFITKVMNDFTGYPEYSRIEALRAELRKDTRVLTVTDMGAGPARTKGTQRKVATIAKNAAKPAKYAQLMHRMIKYYGAAKIIELGTSLGLTTAYLAKANPRAEVVTMEGAGAVAAVAEENFRKLGISNIEIVEGNFDSTLQGVLDNVQRPDFIFIDGNHRQEPTERYFEQLLPYVHNNTLLVFDDIHWSKEMETAWKNIVAHDAVTCDIDLFYIGIVGFRKEFKEKQTFAVRF